MSADVGQPAPDFSLKSHTGATVTLSQFKGDKPVALVFIPFAFTSVCEGELCAIQEDFSPFETAGVEVLAISCDSSPTQKRWADANGWTFEVLSDFWPHGEVARAYDTFNEQLGCANRVTVLVDRDGTVVDRFESPNLGTARTAERYQEALAKL